MSNSSAWLEPRIFGAPVPGWGYDLRPGVYAVVLDAAGSVAVVHNPRGAFLPGGGVEPGETSEQALRREVREECGYAIDAVERLGEATQYVLSPGKVRGLEKRGVFFRATFGERLGEPTSSEDCLAWLAPELALRTLTLASQVWVTERVAGWPAQR
jgi:8-oxo-dGTP diphosphatase